MSHIYSAFYIIIYVIILCLLITSNYDNDLNYANGYYYYRRGQLHFIWLHFLGGYHLFEKKNSSKVSPLHFTMPVIII